MPKGLKHRVLRHLTGRLAVRLLRPLTHGRACIFMLHRFRHDERGIRGHDPGPLREALAWLRRERFELLPLSDVFDRLAHEGRPLRRAVAFTIDDGYADHAEIAAPLFGEFDCPVTTFVVSGFLDGALWLWWDRIAYAFAQSPRTGVSVAFGGGEVGYSWTDAAGRRVASLDFIERCKLVPDTEKVAAIEVLAQALEVTLPVAPPAPFAPMTWDDLRRAERRGMSFGPHTVTHPVLTRTTNEQAHYEISESWRRLRAEAADPVPIFCYPNGGWDDFGAREVTALEEAGMAGAVVGVTGYAAEREVRASPTARYAVRRFAFPDDLVLAAQYAGGFERFKTLVRGLR